MHDLSTNEDFPRDKFKEKYMVYNYDCSNVDWFETLKEAKDFVISEVEDNGSLQSDFEIYELSKKFIAERIETQFVEIKRNKKRGRPKKQ